MIGTNPTVGRGKVQLPGVVADVPMPAPRRLRKLGARALGRAGAEHGFLI